MVKFLSMLHTLVAVCGCVVAIIGMFGTQLDQIEGFAFAAFMFALIGATRE